MSVVELDGLRKTYGDVTALRGVDLTVEAGEVFGFLGPNGAGKSTTINIMLDFASPTEGEARVLGEDPRRDSVAVRRRTGSLLEGYGVYEHLTAREHLTHAIETRGADDDPDELIGRVNLEDAADRRAGGFSKGMKQRLALAVALVDEPELLVLDEPSTGLDPNGARTLRDIVREERDRGATVFFSSHILEQVEAVADEVGILYDGEIVAEDSVDNLRDELGAGSTLVVELTGDPDPLADIDRIEGVRDVTFPDGRLEAVCDDADTKLRVLNRVSETGRLGEFDVHEASLGEVFSRYTRGDGTGGDADGEAAADGGRR
ncbi:ABC transporter ATP-binding protein [Halobacteriales archaeon QS_4_70_19]|nr:MAG: ABC transporter ATP-binding protein [Halobacteriales archaeon QS_4_70_19]